MPQAGRFDGTNHSLQKRLVALACAALWRYDGPYNGGSDRMGYLLDTMTPARVDGQRDVVKNERRQSYENRPYGMADLLVDELLFPKGHPYSWSTIGSMEDLTAASHEDVQQFFRTFYAPNNASLVIAGDIDVAATQTMVEHWFGDVPRGAAYPYVTFGITSDRDWSTATEGGSEHILTLHVWSRAAGRRESDAILDAVGAALHDAAPTLAGHRLVNLRREHSEVRRDPDGETYHGLVRFRAVTEPAS